MLISRGVFQEVPHSPPPISKKMFGHHPLWGGFLLLNTIDGGNVTLCDVMIPLEPL